MIPILYEKDELLFTSNGIGRLRDTISAVVSEERNGVFELDLEYPITGANYELIQVGRIIGVTHDETGDIQPFDIVSYTKPIDGVVLFHCVHISYRMSYLTVTGSNINSLADAFTLLGNSEPANPFSYWTDKTSTGYLAAADGVPKAVRQILGGVEGSILDAYGGEYEFDKWSVKLWSARGQYRDFSIRYGVNMLDYNEELDSSGTYSSCIPYWTDGTTTVVGDKQTNGGITPSGREQCVPLDVSEKFEDQPTKAQVEAMGLQVMNNNNPTIPTQNITVSFVRLQDMGEFADFQNLLQCKLCDTINVIFPDYNSSGQFKIVKTVWNVLTGRYDEMELGDLSITLSEALGITDFQNSSKTTIQEIQERLNDEADYIVEQGTSNSWNYRKWNSGIAECWRNYTASIAVTTQSAGYGGYRSSAISVPTYPFAFIGTPTISATIGSNSNGAWINNITPTTTGGSFLLSSAQSNAATSRTLSFYVIGKWK